MATLAQLRTRVRQRSNNEHTNGQFVTDGELNGLINVAYKDLYGTLVEKSLHRTETTQTVTATGATSYALNADLYSLLNVYWVENGYRRRLRRFSDRAKPGSADVGVASTYRVKGSTVVFWPNPSSGTYEIDYIPVPGDLVADEDVLDGVLAWEEYVVLEAATQVLQKEGLTEEANSLRSDRDRILQRIENQASLVEFSETRVIENTTSGSDLSEGTWWPRRGYRGSIR